MKRIAFIIATLLLPLGIVLGVGVPAAQAQSGNTFCQFAQSGLGPYWCINAWGGGPAVDIYSGDDAVNDDFTIRNLTTGAVQLEFTGGGPNNGYCIGDWDNSKTDARAGLAPCGSDNGSGAGWGTILETYGCGTINKWYDRHWNGFIVGGFSNGDPVYMNGSTGSCFFLGSPVP